MNKKIKTLFLCRIVMWVISAGATVYWIYWSFKLYENGSIDEELYASLLRPHFYAGLGIAIVCILISFGLRKISDDIKAEHMRQAVKGE